MPYCSIAVRCALVGYPAFLSHPYFGNSWANSCIILSRVTFAIIDAAAIDSDLESPFTIGRQFKFGMALLPSTSVISGALGRASMARRIASNEACNIFISSISRAVASADAHIVFFVIQSYAVSRCAAVSFLLSVMIMLGGIRFLLCSLFIIPIPAVAGMTKEGDGKITAAATTGPANGPRPASSVPATIRFGCSFSISNVGNIIVFYWVCSGTTGLPRRRTHSCDAAPRNDKVT